MADRVQRVVLGAAQIEPRDDVEDAHGPFGHAARLPAPGRITLSHVSKITRVQIISS